MMILTTEVWREMNAMKLRVNSLIMGRWKKRKKKWAGGQGPLIKKSGHFSISFFCKVLQRDQEMSLQMDLPLFAQDNQGHIN